MNFYLIAGLFIVLLRLAAGIFDGSLSLTLSGIWGLYSLMRIHRFNSENRSDISLYYPVYLQITVMTILAVILSGTGIQCIKQFFRIHMGVESDPFGLPSLLTVIFTLIFWEGCFLFLTGRSGKGKVRSKLHLLLGLGVFSIISAGFFFKGNFYLLDPAFSFIICSMLFFRILAGLVVEINSAFNSRLENSETGDPSDSDSLNTVY